MHFTMIKSKLFNNYINILYGDLYSYQFDQKIIFYKDYLNRHNSENWILYYDMRRQGIFIFAEQKFYPIDQLMEKINKLKVFL